MKTSTCTRAAFAILGLFASCASAATYTITDLGTLGGSSTATSISENGLIAGSAAVSQGSTVSHAFLYDRTKATPMLDLDTLGGSSFGRSVNDAGQVVGWCDNVNGLKRAFLYTPGAMNPQMEEIDDLQDPSKPTHCGAFAINNTGKVAGYSQIDEVSYAHVFLFTPSDPLPADLDGTLPSHTRAYGLAMNEKGTVVGYSAQTDDFQTSPLFPIVCTGGQTKEIVNPLGGTGGEARGVNNLDHVVGLAYVNGTDFHAFFDDGTGMKDLGTLGGKTSLAYDVNDSGVIVGSAKTGDGSEHAFVHSAGKMVDLNDALVGGAGWVLKRANAINNAGEIVGQGTNPGGELRAFLLTPVVKGQASALPPRLRVTGRRKYATSRAKITLRGTATGEVTQVTLKNGRKSVKVIGTASWRAKVRLKPGRNKLTALAAGPGGASAPARITVIRK